MAFVNITALDNLALCASEVDERMLPQLDEVRRQVVQGEHIARQMLAALARVRGRIESTETHRVLLRRDDIAALGAAIAAARAAGIGEE